MKNYNKIHIENPKIKNDKKLIFPYILELEKGMKYRILPQDTRL